MNRISKENYIIFITKKLRNIELYGHNFEQADKMEYESLKQIYKNLTGERWNMNNGRFSKNKN